MGNFYFHIIVGCIFCLILYGIINFFITSSINNDNKLEKFSFLLSLNIFGIVVALTIIAIGFWGFEGMSERLVMAGELFSQGRNDPNQNKTALVLLWLIVVYGPFIWVLVGGYFLVKIVIKFKRDKKSLKELNAMELIFDYDAAEERGIQTANSPKGKQTVLEAKKKLED